MSDDREFGPGGVGHDQALARIVAVIRQPVPPAAGLEDRVMASIMAPAAPASAEPEARVERSEPRTLRRLALAAAIGALMLGSAWVGRITAPADGDAGAGLATGGGAALPATAMSEGNAVRFVVAAPGASSVSLVGDFNSWNLGATPLAATERDGVWSVTIPLDAGRHEYAFVVDGVRWIADPNAPRAGSSDFGPANSVVTVTGRT